MASAPAAAVASTGSLRILLIEDSPGIIDAMTELLEDMDHRVWSAQDGEQGIALVRELRPDVILCDLGLPGLSGLEICRRIRALELDRQPAIVALTGWGRAEDHRRTEEAGFDHHIVKPVRADDLIRVLDQVVSDRR